MQLNRQECAPFLSFKGVFVQAESYLITRTYKPMDSCSTLTISFECLDHGGTPGTNGPVQPSIASLQSGPG